MKALGISLIAVLGFYNSFAQAPGNAFSFDGDNDIINVTNQAKFNITSAITLEAWVTKKNVFSEWPHIISKGTDDGVWALRGAGGSGRICFTTGIGEVQSTTTLVGDKWYHVAGVFNGTSISIYINGILETTSPATGPLPSSSAMLYIGGTTWNNRCWNGGIDELRIWNIARTATEIKASMNNVIAPTTTGLVAYYKFDQGTPGANNSGVNTLTDLTTSPGNGVFAGNIALSGTNSNWIESYAMVVPEATTASTVVGNAFIANWTAPVVGTVNNYLLDVSTSPTFSSFVTGYNGLSVASSATSKVITGVSPNTNYYYRVRADKTSVTTWGGYSNTISLNTGVILPVTWLSFTAQQQSGQIALQWSTATEVNTQNYVIQHSINGASWKDIDVVSAAGNTNHVSQYRYTHTSPANGINYYRLLQRDIDGKSSYSVIAKATANIEKLLTIYPNPVTDGVLRMRVNRPGTVYIYRSNGQLAIYKQVSEGVQTLNVDHLGKGTFAVKMDGTVQQLIIQ